MTDQFTAEARADRINTMSDASNLRNELPSGHRRVFNAVPPKEDYGSVDVRLGRLRANEAATVSPPGEAGNMFNLAIEPGSEADTQIRSGKPVFTLDAMPVVKSGTGEETNYTLSRVALGIRTKEKTVATVKKESRLGYAARVLFRNASPAVQKEVVTTKEKGDENLVPVRLPLVADQMDKFRKSLADAVAANSDLPAIYLTKADSANREMVVSTRVDEAKLRTALNEIGQDALAQEGSEAVKRLNTAILSSAE